MKITIKKDKHLSKQITKPRFGLWNNGEVIVEVTFTEASTYLILGDDDKDWNKLSAGATWGFFPLVKQYMAHENSSRWGYRFDKASGKMELTPYFYSQGVRNYAETLGIEPIKLDLYKKYKLTIKPYASYVKYKIEDKEGNTLFDMMFEQVVPSITGWECPAYFGGTKPAPKDVSYELNYLTT
jgi:hypothetical protein